MFLEETGIYRSASIYKFQKSIEIRGETMRDFLLLAVVLGFFVFGFFVVKKLDCFLERCLKAESLLPVEDGDRLKIGFSNPHAGAAPEKIHGSPQTEEVEIAMEVWYHGKR